MRSVIRSVRGYLSIGIGIVACPCHLPLTLPLLLGLTAGSAFSAWLAAHTALVYGLSTLIFISGIAMGISWLSSPTRCDTESKGSHSNRASRPLSQSTDKY